MASLCLKTGFPGLTLWPQPRSQLRYTDWSNEISLTWNQQARSFGI